MKVGLITYHSAYNFGSVLQALATQIVVEEFGHEVAIINYRPISQKHFYAIVNVHSGIKRFVKSVLRLNNLKGLLLRKQRYEEFMETYLKTTLRFENPDAVIDYAEAFDIFISGSDQIWNKNSNELKNVGWEYMNPYLLTFTSKKKISYASSLNDMQQEDLLRIKDSLGKFHHISCREQTACNVIGNLLGRRIENVLDPTLLLTMDKWNNILPRDRVINDNYVLYYSLRGISDVNEDLANLLRKYKKVAVIAPLSPVRPSSKIISMDDAGPSEFLRLVRDADCIVTTSYHGTLFSINFHKKFFSIKGKNKNSNFRFEDILNKTGLGQRLIESTSDVNDDPIDYRIVDARLIDYRIRSLDYLKRSIEA